MSGYPEQVPRPQGRQLRLRRRLRRRDARVQGGEQAARTSSPRSQSDDNPLLCAWKKDQQPELQGLDVVAALFIAGPDRADGGDDEAGRGPRSRRQMIFKPALRQVTRAPAAPTIPANGSPPRRSSRRTLQQKMFRTSNGTEQIQRMSTDPGSVSPVVLSLQGVSKRFGAVQALRRREHGVPQRARSTRSSGENGSGKSTLLGIASGVLAPDAGVSRSAASGFDTASAGDAQALRPRHGVPDVLASVLELSRRGEPLPAAPRASRPSYGAMERLGGASRRAFDLSVDADGADGQPAARRAADARGRQGAAPDPKVLAPRRADDGARARSEVERLHALVLDLAARGVGVIYVSHRLPEVLERRAPRHGAPRRRRARAPTTPPTCPRRRSSR